MPAHFLRAPQDSKSLVAAEARVFRAVGLEAGGMVEGLQLGILDQDGDLLDTAIKGTLFSPPSQVVIIGPSPAAAKLFLLCPARRQDHVLMGAGLEEGKVEGPAARRGCG